jgi:PPM family protein phosphatase
VLVAAVSKRGARESNEDVVYVDDTLILLADGMGGSPGGRQVAQVAVGSALSVLTSPTEGAVRDAFSAANSSVLQYRIAHSEHHSAGSTLTIVAVRESPVSGLQALVGHVGDSPAFHIRGGELTLLTPPHTLTESLRTAGRISEREATTHPGRHVLQRSIGAHRTIDPEVHTIDIREGDRLLVSSDGLLEVPDRRRIRDIARQNVTVTRLAEELATLATRSSTDNVTVVLMDIDTSRAGTFSSRD